jgi:NAD+--asparagine ADP-ribosyltransferase
VLIWLQSATAPWTDAKKTYMIKCAAEHGRMDGVKWLREAARAPWHPECYAAKLYKSGIKGNRSMKF